MRTFWFFVGVALVALSLAVLAAAELPDDRPSHEALYRVQFTAPDGTVQNLSVPLLGGRLTIDLSRQVAR